MQKTTSVNRILRHDLQRSAEPIAVDLPPASDWKSHVSVYASSHDREARFAYPAMLTADGLIDTPERAMEFAARLDVLTPTALADLAREKDAAQIMLRIIDVCIEDGVPTATFRRRATNALLEEPLASPSGTARPATLMMFDFNQLGKSLGALPIDSPPDLVAHTIKDALPAEITPAVAARALVSLVDSDADNSLVFFGLRSNATLDDAALALADNLRRGHRSYAACVAGLIRGANRILVNAGFEPLDVELEPAPAAATGATRRSASADTYRPSNRSNYRRFLDDGAYDSSSDVFRPGPSSPASTGSSPLQTLLSNMLSD